MKKDESLKLSETRKSIVDAGLAISKIDLTITTKRPKSIYELVRRERELIKQQKGLVIKSHLIENRLVEMGDATISTGVQTIKRSTNQYAR